MKSYILDTNILLYDYQSIYNFSNSNIIIPIIVLEELDKIKKGNDFVNVSARKCIRELNKLFELHPQKTEFPLGKNLGKLKIQIDGFDITHTSPIFAHPTNDTLLLALTLNLSKTSKNEFILVTNDINLRIKAIALGIKCTDYQASEIKNFEELYTGYRAIQVSSDIINEVNANALGISIPEISEPIPNEFFILKNGEHSTLVTFDALTEKFIKLQYHSAAGINSKNVEQTFAINALLNPEIPLVSLIGTSGSGKTLLALACGIALKRMYTQIFISRAPIPVGKDIGYLPGDWQEKLDPYMQSIWDNFEVIQKDSKIKNLSELRTENKIKVEPLPYLRGRSLSRIFYIIDEAQNLSPHEVKTIITRAGEGTKIVFTGDINQIDTPYLDSRSNGLSTLVYKMAGQRRYAHINLVHGVRSELAELASNIL